MRKKLIMGLVAMAMFATTAVATPQPAKAADLANAKGCGTNLTLSSMGIGLSTIVDAIVGGGEFDVTISGMKFECVLSVQPIDLGFAVLPLGTALASSGTATATIHIDASIEWCYIIIPCGIDIAADDIYIHSATANSCMGFSFNIKGLTGPERAVFSCPSLITKIKNNGPDNTYGLFGIGFGSAYFTMVEGGLGSVNGLAPFQAFTDWWNSWLNPLVNQIANAALGENVTAIFMSPVQVNLKP